MREEKIVVGEFITATGQTVEVGGGFNRIPEFKGKHLWVTIAAWRVDPDKWSVPNQGPTHLDTENLLYIGGLGCYFCEQHYEPRLKDRRCKGNP